MKYFFVNTVTGERKYEVFCLLSLQLPDLQRLESFCFFFNGIVQSGEEIESLDLSSCYVYYRIVAAMIKYLFIIYVLISHFYLNPFVRKNRLSQIFCIQVNRRIGKVGNIV